MSREGYLPARDSSEAKPINDSFDDRGQLVEYSQEDDGEDDVIELVTAPPNWRTPPQKRVAQQTEPPYSAAASRRTQGTDELPRDDGYAQLFASSERSSAAADDARTTCVPPVYFVDLSSLDDSLPADITAACAGAEKPPLSHGRGDHEDTKPVVLAAAFRSGPFSQQDAPPSLPFAYAGRDQASLPSHQQATLLENASDDRRRGWQQHEAAVSALQRQVLDQCSHHANHQPVHITMMTVLPCQGDDAYTNAVYDVKDVDC